MLISRTKGKCQCLKDFFISASMYRPSIDIHCLIIGRVILSCPQLLEEALRRDIFMSNIETTRNLNC